MNKKANNGTQKCKNVMQNFVRLSIAISTMVFCFFVSAVCVFFRRDFSCMDHSFVVVAVCCWSVHSFYAFLPIFANLCSVYIYILCAAHL